ncbi:hypothetical protein PIB30_054620 [Stylosanthes scabra]|uniref:Longin domain-containing protein n=1 Tax=Stylosanthes scabra TaxID=79078 RepID=A0ABU6TJE3_9FABA|nr:hypothetical protein [Stylosanthes scabra]
MEKQTTHQSEDPFPIFVGKDGYRWTIFLEQYWSARGTLEKQRFSEVERGLKGKALLWFHLWKARNPFADLETFMVALYHRYEQDMRPILLDICCKDVEDWEIEWEEMKARLTPQQWPEIIQEGAEIVDPAQFQNSDPKIIDLGTIMFNDEIAEEEAADLTPDPFATTTHNFSTATRDGEAIGYGDCEEHAVVATPGERTGDVDDDARSSAEVGASVNWKEKAMGVIEMMNATQLYHRDEKASKPLWSVSPIVAKPPPLIAVVLPWNRDSEINAEMPSIARSIPVDALGRGTLVDGVNASAMNLAIVPISSLMKVMTGGTNERPPAELQSRLESLSVNPFEVRVADAAVRARVVEAATSLPTTTHNEPMRGEELGVDVVQVWWRLKLGCARTGEEQLIGAPTESRAGNKGKAQKFNYLIDNGVLYCVLEDECVGRKLSIAFIEQVEVDFVSTSCFSDKASTNAVKNSLNMEFESKLKEHQPEEINMLAKVFTVNGGIMGNCEKVLYKGEKIKFLVDINAHAIAKDGHCLQGTDLNHKLQTLCIALAQASNISACDFSVVRSELELVEKIGMNLFEKCIEMVHKCIDTAKMEKREVHGAVIVDEAIAWSITFIDELQSIACTHAEI